MSPPRLQLLFAGLALACGSKSSLPPPPPEPEPGRCEAAVLEAVRAARERVLAEPEDPGARRELAMILDANELYDLARDGYRGALALSPANPSLSYHLGRMAQELGDPVGALTAFDRAAELEPRYAPAHWRRGNLLCDLGRPEEARAAYRSAIDLAPNDVSGWIGLGRVALQEDRPAEAVEPLERAHALAPRDGFVRRLLARALQRTGRTERARELLAGELTEATAAWIDPWEEDVLLRAAGFQDTVRTARRLLGEGKPARALELLDPLAAQHPDDVTLEGMRTAALVALGRTQEALADLDRLEELHPAHYRVATNRGVLLHMTGRSAEALAELERAIGLHPGFDDAQAYLGRVRLDLGDAAGAAEAFAAAVENRGTGPAVFDGWLAATRALGDDPGRLRAAELACTHHPDVPRYWQERVDALAALGRGEEALEVLGEARRRLPDEPGLASLAAVSRALASAGRGGGSGG